MGRVKKQNPEEKRISKVIECYKGRKLDMDGACEECSMKCLLVHGNRDPSPIITSFFKVILGDTISKALVIPPNFAKTIKSLVDKKTYLEDPTGQRWKVKICSIGGKLAFQHGWHEFASDHSIESGDFVVFYYITGSHFVVQAYSRSGCEKLSFFDKCNKRRSSTKAAFGRPPSDGGNTGRNLTPIESPSTTVDKGLENEQGSCSTTHFDSDAELIKSKCNIQDVEKLKLSQEQTSNCGNTHARSKPLPKDFYEVQLDTTDSGVIAEQGAHKSSLFDFSVNSKSVASKINGAPLVIEKKLSPHCDAHLGEPQSKPETYLMVHQCRTIDKEPKGSRGASIGISDLKLPEKNRTAKDLFIVPLTQDKISRCSNMSQQPRTTIKVDSCENVKVNGNTSEGVLGKYPLPEKQNRVCSDLPRKASAPQMKRGTRSRCPEPFTDFAWEMSEVLTGKKLKVVKEELVEKDKGKQGKGPVVVKSEDMEMVSHLEVEGQACKVVKTETVESTDCSSFKSGSLCCSVSSDTQFFLELPKRFPLFSCIGNTRIERKIVLLRDLAMKVWPVLYHERAGFRVLTSGWEALAKANNIVRGDVCIFEVENEAESLYRVRVTRK